jgi:hypothetical protein
VSRFRVTALMFGRLCLPERESRMAIESPKYRVLERDGKFEVREYDSYIAASVVIDASYGEALNSGFRILADYIFGNNRSRAHIDMTAPVTGQAVKSENIKMSAPVMTAVVERGTKYRISFPMPGKYALDTLPLPTDERVTIEEVKSHRVASLAFRGYLSEKASKNKGAELATWMKNRGMSATSELVLAQYNPPWIPGPFRRNEILADLK